MLYFIYGIHHHYFTYRFCIEANFQQNYKFVIIMKKVYYLAAACFLCVVFLYMFQKTQLQSGEPSLTRAVLEVFSRNEGVVYPKQNLNSENFPEISAKAYMAVYEGDAGEKDLISKNPDERVPIASITKLAVSMVALNSSGSLLAPFSSSTIGEASKGRYATSDILPVKELIKSMLVESDNDAARAICENESSNFIERMNSFARYINAPSTTFYNCTGLDGENGGTNISTTHDVIEIMRSLVKNRPELLDTMSSQTANILNVDGSLHHVAVSTYEFVGSELPFPILGGKTGQTDLAKQNLVLALKAPKGILYVAVLGSDDRFSDMKTLVDYVYKNFDWSIQV